MKREVQKREERMIWILRMSLVLAAILYILFGFFLKHVLAMEDLIPLTHRLFFAASLLSLVGLSFISSSARQNMGFLVFGTGVVAVLHMFYIGSKSGFDRGAMVALILVIPVMNALLFRWKLLLYGNALLLVVIVLFYATTGPSSLELILFLLSIFLVSGVSFWFTRQLLLSEKKAHESEELFSDLFHYSMDGIAIQQLVVDGRGDPVDYKFLRINTMFKTYTGLKEEDLIGKKATEVFSKIGEVLFLKEYSQVVLTGQPITFEHYFEQLQCHYRINAYPMGKSRFATAFTDITKEKRDEEEICKKNEFIQMMIKSLPDAVIYVFDLIEQKNIYISKSLGDVLGYSPEEFQGMGDEVLQRLIHPDDDELFMDHLASFQTLHRDDVKTLEYRIKHRDGDWNWMENRDSIFMRDESGDPIQLIGSAINITERKGAQSKIERQTSLITSLLNSIPDLIFYKDIHGVYLGCNPAFAEHIGRSPEDIIGKTDYDLYPHEEASAFRENDRRMLELSGPRYNEEWITYPNGDRVLIDTLKTPYRGPDGEIIGILGISRDITERKEAEEKLAQRDQLLTKLSQQVPGAIYQYQFFPDGTSLFPFASDGIWDIYGVTPDEIKHTASTVYSRIHPEDFDRVVYSIRDSWENLTIWEDEYRVLLPERGLRWVRGVARPEKISDGSVLWHGYLADVSEMKAIERSLKESEERFRALYENSPVSIVIHDKNSGEIVHANNTAYLSYGYRSLEELQNKVFSLEPPYSQEDALAWIHKAVAEGPQVFEWKNLDSKGEVFWEQVRLTPITIHENQRVLSTTIGITERIEAEEALKESERRYRALISNVPGVIFQCSNDDHWTMEFISEEIQSITGYSAAGFINNRERSYASILHEEDVEYVSHRVQVGIASCKPYSIDYRIVHANGSIRWINEKAQGIFSEKGDLLYLYGVITDVTEQKKTEIALQESEEKFRQISETMGEVFWLRNADNTEMIYVNPAYETIWGRTCESLYEYPNSFLDSVIYEDRSMVLEEFRRYLKTGEFNLEYRIERPSGELRWIHARSFPVKDNDDRIIRHTGLAVDITRQKQVEEKLVEYTEELEHKGREMDVLYNALDTEIQNARRAHQHLIQKRLPQIEGLSLAVVHQPATFIGGDFSYAIRKGDRLILYVSDITGHGLEGTLFGLFVKGCIESYIELVPESEIVPDKILAYLDEQVHIGRYPSEYTVAIFMMVINTVTHKTTFSAAGFQNPPVLVHSDGSLERLLSKGLPISPDIPTEVMNFGHHVIHLPEASFTLVATDGIYEQYRGDEMYEKRLLSLLKECTGLPKETIADVVYKDFCDFRGDEEQSDDVTYVVLSTESFEEHRLPSSFDSLKTIREYVLTYYRDHTQCEAIAMAIHELVANAIEHGNQFHKEKSVWVQFSSRAVVIEDEGDGFDWREKIEGSLNLHLKSKRGRGITIVQLLIGDLVYNREGNRVSLMLKGKDDDT